MLRGLWNLTWLEIKIFLREPLGAIGTIVVPVLAFVLLGRVTAGRTAPPPATLTGLLSAGGISTLVSILITISAVLSLVTIISIYREGGILKRLRATPLRPWTILGAHVLVKLALTALTMAAMALSGLCAVMIGLSFGGPPALTFALAVFWGITVIADSAQFSTAVTELSPPAYVGTALTAQTCVGFALTMVSIWLIPPVVRAIGWEWAFAMLAPGPALGVLAMARLRASPESLRMAGGRR